MLKLLPHLESFRPIVGGLGYAADGSEVYVPVSRLIPYIVDIASPEPLLCYDRQYELMRNGKPVNGVVMLKQITDKLILTRETAKKAAWYIGDDGRKYFADTAVFHSVGQPHGYEYRPVYEWAIWAIEL
jgi:hypothetical protein